MKCCDRLERECRAYTRYLTGQWPTEYVVEKYREFHTLAGFEPEPFDEFLVETSARGPFRARLAASYTSLFYKESAVRKKLVVALAILECSPPFCTKLDAVNRGGAAGAILRMGFGAARYAACLALAAALFTPVRMGLAARRKAPAWTA